jgi:hypothetical protein
VFLHTISSRSAPSQHDADTRTRSRSQLPSPSRSAHPSRVFQVEVANATQNTLWAETCAAAVRSGQWPGGWLCSSARRRSAVPSVIRSRRRWRESDSDSILIRRERRILGKRPDCVQ